MWLTPLALSPAGGLCPRVLHGKRRQGSRSTEELARHAATAARPEPKLGLLARPDSPPPVWLDRGSIDSVRTRRYVGVVERRTTTSGTRTRWLSPGCSRPSMPAMRISAAATPMAYAGCATVESGTRA